MKKAYTLILAMLIITASLAQKTQSRVKNGEVLNSTRSITNTEWSMAPTGISFTDIDGIVHYLDDYLNDGKTVILSQSAHYCTPAWELHQANVLQDLYNTYGPDGTDELMVFWCDYVSTTTIDELNGDPDSEGDWVTGTPFPIVMDDVADNLDLDESFWHQIFAICPNYAYRSVIDEAILGVDELYTAVEECVFAGEVPLANFIGPVAGLCESDFNGFINTEYTFTDRSMTTDPLISWEWTFEGGNPATSTEENPIIQWTTGGIHNITLIATNANGESQPVTKQIDMSDQVNVSDYHVTFEECIDFNQGFAPYNWTTLDMDGGNTYGWGTLEYPGLGEPLPFMVWNSTILNEQGQDVSPDMVTYEGEKAAVALASYGVSNNDDWLISPQLLLGTDSEIRFWAKTFSIAYGNEWMKVGISTSDNNPNSFTFINSGSHEEVPYDYTEYVYDISAYDNQQVYIAIECVSDDASVLFIDNIDINTTATNVEITEADKIRVYPNPTTGVLNISNIDNAIVSVFNLLGEEQMTENKDNVIDISSLPEGNYIVKIQKRNKLFTKKVTLTK